MVSNEAPDSGQSTGPRAPRLRHPRACRLRSGQDFGRIYRHGVRVRGRFILLVAAESLNPSVPRLGLSVGRKYHKLAAKRNRVRRVFRESFRLGRPKLPPMDMILIPVARDQPYSVNDCQSELVYLAQKAWRKWQRRQQQKPADGTPANQSKAADA
jgi:ribonuclease P protein component